MLNKDFDLEIFHIKQKYVTIYNLNKQGKTGNHFCWYTNRYATLLHKNAKQKQKFHSQIPGNNWRALYYIGVVFNWTLASMCNYDNI